MGFNLEYTIHYGNFKNKGKNLRQIMQKRSGAVVYSPSDLIRYFASPFASWMGRYYLEDPDGIMPDETEGLEEIRSYQVS